MNKDFSNKDVLVYGQVTFKLDAENMRGGHKQVCAMKTSLRKKLYLFPYDEDACIT